MRPLLVLPALIASACYPAADPSIYCDDTSTGNASVTYCEALGYTYDNDTCVFSGRDSCPSWNFYRGQCGTEYSWCERQGYTLEHREDQDGIYVDSYAMCVFDDGTECREQEFLCNECGPES